MFIFSFGAVVFKNVMAEAREAELSRLHDVRGVRASTAVIQVLDVARDRRLVLLESTIVALIVFEIVLTLVGH